jgi:hypothetical protein
VDAAVTGAAARLYNLGEVVDVQRALPANVLEARFQQGLGQALQWAAMPQIRCVVCDAELSGEGAYLAVLMPLDEELGLGCSGVVCMGCAETHDRPWLQRAIECTATLIFEPHRGRA